jgi:hypothetical protein
MEWIYWRNGAPTWEKVRPWFVHLPYHTWCQDGSQWLLQQLKFSIVFSRENDNDIEIH